MTITTFQVPRTIVHGVDSLEYLKNLEGKKAVLVTGGHSMKKFGFLDQAKKYLEEAGMEVMILDVDGIQAIFAFVLSGGLSKAANFSKLYPGCS